MKRSSILLLLLVYLTTGCTEKDVLLYNSDDKSEIKVISSISVIDISADNRSRAPFEGYINNDNAITARIIGSKDDQGFDINPYLNGTMTFSDTLSAVPYNELSTVESKSEQQKFYYPNSGGINLYGLYPSDISNDNDQQAWYIIGNNTASFSFDGKQDVMVAPRVYSTASEADNQIYQKLKFQHILTLLDIYIQSDPTDGYTGKVKKISLVGCDNDKLPYRNAEVNFTDNTYTVNMSNNDTSTFPFWDWSDNEFTDKDIAVTILRQKIAYSMVSPVEATSFGNEYKLHILFDNNVEKDVPINLYEDGQIKFTGSTSGKRFKLVLNVHSLNSGIEIEVTATVEPWEDVSENIIDIQ